MSDKKMMKPLSLAVGVALAASMGPVSVGASQDGLFNLTSLSGAYMVRTIADDADSEGSCGEGRCGGDTHADEGHCGGDTEAGGDADAEASCGGDHVEGSCGGNTDAEGSCGGHAAEEGGDADAEAHCGGDADADAEAHCGGNA